MMLADDPADMLHFRKRIIRSEAPDNRSRRLVSDSDNVRFPGIPDNIVRMEPLVTGVIEFIRADVRSGIDVQPVAYAAAEMTEGAGVRITEQDVLGRFIKAELGKMITGLPLPHNRAVPVHF
ncbi:hypothetical protein D3C73_1228380 [compost metagenome]